MRQYEFVNQRKGKPDVATVTSEGVPLASGIDGVVVHQPPVHVDHRGHLVEMFTIPQFWTEGYAYAYQTSLRPQTLKGWFSHDHKDDRYHLVVGDIILFLFDDREDSPTAGRVQKVALSEMAARQVLIPRGVWHLLLNVGSNDAIVVNLPTQPYDHAEPDRRYTAYDSGEIPVDVRAYFSIATGAVANPAVIFD